MTVQGTQEWFDEKLGHASASRVDDIMAKGKNGAPSAMRENYLWELALERITGKRSETFSGNAHTDRGTATEPFARMAFEAATGILMEEVGFIKHATVPWVGASPDGLCGREGMEAKCRMPKGHGKVLLGGSLGSVVRQMDFQMWACDLDASWFVSYCDAFPRDLQLFYERVKRDAQREDAIVAATMPFLAEVESLVDRLLNARKAA